MSEIDWYFDFISPYAYLQFCQFERQLESQLETSSEKISIRYRPLLFAGLLDHWGHKGPAEIPGKRIFTFRQAHWLAKRDGIPYRLPPHHPFNPLRALRLAIALGSKPEPIGQIFRAIWTNGYLPDDQDGWNGIIHATGCKDPDQAIADQKVKDELRDNGNRAIAQGIFGVPTAVIDGALFWGQDSTEFLLDFIQNPLLFEDPDMKRIESTKPSATRPARS